MQKSTKYRTAVFLSILFMTILSGPTIITSFDDSVDVSGFYSINEEEENENLKLVFEDIKDDLNNLMLFPASSRIIGYTFKTYPKPPLNLIVPPPDFIS